jgi:hypothetical protein
MFDGFSFMRKAIVPYSLNPHLTVGAPPNFSYPIWGKGEIAIGRSNHLRKPESKAYS